MKTKLYIKTALLLCCTVILTTFTSAETRAGTSLNTGTNNITLVSKIGKAGNQVSVYVGNDGYETVPSMAYGTFQPGVLSETSAYYDLSSASSISFRMVFCTNNKYPDADNGMDGWLTSLLYLVDSKGKKVQIDDNFINNSVCEIYEGPDYRDNGWTRYESVPSSYGWEMASNKNTYYKDQTVNPQNYRSSIDLTNCKFQWYGGVKIHGYTRSESHHNGCAIAVENLKVTVTHSHSYTIPYHNLHQNFVSE